MLTPCCIVTHNYISFVKFCLSNKGKPNIRENEYFDEKPNKGKPNEGETKIREK